MHVMLFSGMSVTSGRFFGDKLSYAGGAPRANGKGMAFLHYVILNYSF